VHGCGEELERKDGMALKEHGGLQLPIGCNTTTSHREHCNGQHASIHKMRDVAIISVFDV